MNHIRCLKHSTEASMDASVQRMISEEGVKAYGLYWLLVEQLCREPFLCISLLKLGTLSRSFKSSRTVLERIITGYGLFVVECGLFYSGYSYHLMGVSRAQMRKNVQQAASPCTSPCTSPCASPCARPCARPRRRASEKTSEGYNSLNISEKKISPCSKRRVQPRGGTSGTSHVRTRISVVDDNIIADNINNNINNNPVPTRMAGCAKPAPVPTSSPKPVPAVLCQVPVAVSIDSLLADRPWVEHVWTSAGLSPSQLNDLPRALEAFKNHIHTYDKEDELPDVRSIRRYFANFIAAETRTGKRLREQLACWQADRLKAPPSKASGSVAIASDGSRTLLDPPAPDAFQFESKRGGKRIYRGGFPIPDDAPPRPSWGVCWDSAESKWNCLSYTVFSIRQSNR